MNEHFESAIATLPDSYRKLRESAPLTEEEIKKEKRGGIYIFSEHGEVLYCGRTRDLSRRYHAHCHASSGENRAAFAFRLARQQSGFVKASYTKKNSRKALMELPEFNDSFQRAKKRILEMELRFIYEPDDIRQALLEIYVSLETGAVHNSFATT